MNLSEKLIELLNAHGFEVSASNKNVLLLKRTSTIELFNDIFIKLSNTFGDPEFVHSFYGFMWKYENEFLAYNISEPKYGHDVITFYIIKKIPLGKKINYEFYIKIVDAVKQELRDQNLDCESYIHYNSDKAFTFFAKNNSARCIIMIKHRTLSFYYSKQTDAIGSKSIVRKKLKIKLQNIVSIQNSLLRCFELN